MLFRRREYSLFSQFSKIILLIYGLFVVSFSLIFLFLNHNMQSNLYDSYCRTIDYCLSGIKNDLEIANRSVLSTLYNNSDLSELSCSNNILNISVCESSLQRTLNSYLQCYSTVDGLFFYSGRNDRFISAVRDTNSFFPVYFRNMMRSVEFSVYYREIPARNGDYVFCQIDGRYCLVRMFTYNNMIGGVWVDLDTIMKKLEQSTSGDTICAFLNDSEMDDPVVNRSTDKDELKRIQEKDSQIVTCSGSRYLKFLTQPPFCCGELLILMPYSQLQQTLDLHYMLQGIFIIILTLCFFSTFLLYSSRLKLPVRELYRISAAVKDSWQPEAIKQQQVSRCKEVREINEEVIRLLEHINSLENQVLQEQLLKKEYELLSLRNQISPHFLINCLSVISSMAGTSVSRTVLKSMISTLASHLRYTLSTKSFVSLAEEMCFVRNYYDLNNYRYPDSLTYQIDIRDLCDNAAVFPCLILMLSENSIKHNLSADEKLKLIVTAREEQDEHGKSYVHITHLDTGNGFPEQMLVDLNRPNPSIEEIADGTRIGLYNIKRRILLAYGESHGSIRFSNNPESGGAQVDIIIPYIPYQES